MLATVYIMAEFTNAPLIETVLGVQFAPLKGLGSAYVGWFWKQYLDSKWEKVAEVVPLLDEFERFGPVPSGPVRLVASGDQASGSRRPGARQRMRL